MARPMTPPLDDRDDQPAADATSTAARLSTPISGQKVWPMAWNAEVSVFMPMKA